MSVVEAAVLDRATADANRKARMRARERVVATVLFTDLVGSTSRAWELGDSAWCELQDRHDALVRFELACHNGHEVDTAGDGFFALFDAPGDAVECACAISHGVRTLGVETRAGLHVGEVERRASKVSGVAVLIGARIAARSRASEVLVSRTLKEVVTGSGIRFHNRGAHRLRGLPGRWHLFAVDQTRDPAAE